VTVRIGNVKTPNSAAIHGQRAKSAAIVRWGNLTNGFSLGGQLAQTLIIT
jgi:hypothetical protein